MPNDDDGLHLIPGAPRTLHGNADSQEKTRRGRLGRGQTGGCVERG